MKVFGFLLMASIFLSEEASAVRISVLNDCIRSIIEKDKRQRSRPPQSQVVDEETRGSRRKKIEEINKEIDTLKTQIAEERNKHWKKFLKDMLKVKKKTLETLVPKKNNELCKKFLKAMRN